jgi:mRNA deadenylase 3'-5' endonuclease subunit Ccr4
MKIISWNILANEFINQSDYPMIKNKILFNRNERLKNIMQMLLKVNADVMLLQEVMEKEFKALTQLFKSKYTIVRGKNINWYNKPSASCNITLLRKTQFKVLKAYDLQFGIYLTALSNANEVIEIINVHLNDESHLKRISQIKSIEEVLYKSNKVILGGDFNQVYKVSSQLYKMIANAGLIPTIHEPTYYIEKKMCIDNLMLKGFQLDNRCSIKKNELNCCNRPINKTKKNAPKKNGSCVINKYKNQVENQFNAYGSDHLLIIANAMGANAMGANAMGANAMGANAMGPNVI